MGGLHSTHVGQHPLRPHHIHHSIPALVLAHALGAVAAAAVVADVMRISDRPVGFWKKQQEKEDKMAKAWE